MSERRAFQRGDTVNFRDGRVDWQVESVGPVHTGGYVTLQLKSGMSGRRRDAFAHDLVLSPRQAHPSFPTTPEQNGAPVADSTPKTGFEKDEEVIYQGTLKAKVVRTLPNGHVIVEFGSGTSSKVVSPLELSIGEVEVVDYS